LRNNKAQKPTPGAAPNRPHLRSSGRQAPDARGPTLGLRL